MTTPEEIAREIQTQLNSMIECPPDIQEVIAAHLRTYGEAEFKRGYEKRLEDMLECFDSLKKRGQEKQP